MGCAASRLAASLQLTVVLLVVLGAALAWGSMLETRHGRELADWTVYANPWFAVLLGLLAGNVLAAALTRCSWRWNHCGLLLVHAGVLMLLVGALQTFRGGVAGELLLHEGQPADRALDRQRTVVTVERATETGRQASEFAFTPGAGDWRETKSLPFPESAGIALRVMKFYRHARPHVDWVADARECEGAALRLAFSDRTNPETTEEWLTASAYGGETHIGPIRFVLWPLSLETMLEDFLHPPADLGTAGVLSVHYRGKIHRFRIDDVRGTDCTTGRLRRVSRNRGLLARREAGTQRSEVHHT